MSRGMEGIGGHAHAPEGAFKEMTGVLSEILKNQGGGGGGKGGGGGGGDSGGGGGMGSMFDPGKLAQTIGEALKKNIYE